ncbi:uncharacterized protein HMPREF1541_07613 [Cyphellophora europaea CBS 101466]|uniref:Nucleolar protein 16 n=1 Tax=Cyphellophora europaea (strain CBS 101466) TaxID=1220924 RepID=W2RNT8_CYPE1|nr:uncharacterized protein HMPREF1541_07613 [Cyphellophora europaea CBS 101466]ETN37990.1 hypothetical protein HMPREF1541_07613 [Cyphellophora europaea CBS 101466]
MGREQQKKKARSSISKSRPKNSKRTKTGRVKVNFGNNELLSKNWDRKETLSQNYARLGLSSRLVAPSGGVERHSQRKAKSFADTDTLAIPSARDTGRLKPQEVRVERDAEGNIVKVVRPESEEEGVFNPLNDPLNEIEAVQPARTRSEAKVGIVEELERQAAKEAEQLEAKRRPRQQSSREEEWIAKLVEKHGDDISAMVRDKKLNPMQQTQGDIGRRVKKWRAKHQAAA